jgi:hypothetical protein
MRRSALFLGVLTLGTSSLYSETPTSPASAPPPAAPKPAAAAPNRGRIAAAAQRNENVAVQQIDTNAAKEANVRIGTRATASQFTGVDTEHFAVEHAQSPTEPLAITAISPRTGWHGEAFWNHQNSIFNARTFFQVGPVLPSRRNSYGFRGTTEVGPLGYFTFTGSQRKIRGMVNGNVLVPLASERIPLTTDPAARAIVQRFLNAYPAQLPNRPDFDPRALNTNAPQVIDGLDGTARLDRDIARSRLSASYTISRQRTDAFQLVAGQNPDSDIHSHRLRLALRTALSPTTELVLAGSFNRTRSSITPEPNAVGPRVRFGYQIEELGPDSHFPTNRTLNSFRYGAQMARVTGAHSFFWGGDVTRFQLNGVETNNQRGYFQFTNNFGRAAIENLRMGTPSIYEVTMGDLYRAYRNWSGGVYFGDRWRIRRVQMHYGLRYGWESAPVEAQSRDKIPYDCDCNNWSPRLGIAAELPHGWLMRTAGAVSFAPIPTVTYAQNRNNPPSVFNIQRYNPSLVDPLVGFDTSISRYSPTVLSPELTSSYAYQYNFTLEHRIFDRYTVRTGYVGSRSYKLMNSFVFNRARNVPGIVSTVFNVDERRPDARYTEIKEIVNAGIAYYDAALVTLDMPLRRGFTATATYTFSKAIDEGQDFTSIAANRDLLSSRSQSEYDSLKDRKGLSNFDSPHALMLDYSYQIPGGRHRMLRGWQISGATLWKSGTPLTLYVGSDSPGFGNVDGAPSDRPNIVDPSILGMTIGDPNTAPLILRRDRFAYIQPGQLRGNLGRGTFRKATIANMNAAISKQINWHDRTVLLRGEAYNLTNTPQFDEPQRNFSSPSFGRITNTLNDGRVLQLGVRFVL